MKGTASLHFSLPQAASLCLTSQARSSHSPLPAGFHWLRAVSVMFEVNVAVHIHNWEHVMVFGEDDPSRARIAVWKSDAETHFEPLVPVHCKPSGGQYPRHLQAEGREESVLEQAL